MYLHAKDKEASNYDLIDLNTNKQIFHCQWANDETGEYCIYSFDKDGNLIFNNDDEIVTKIKKGNIKLQKK